MTCRERKTMLSGSCRGFHALPEGCIANALSLTSPKDACRLSLVASTFRSAADSDVVWERFLPPDYVDIISRSIDGPDSLLTKFHSKKELYFHLCDNPIIIDSGTKSFSLEKGTGKKCFMLAARDLIIVWGDTPQYWAWISLPGSRFPEVAELLKVTWFEVRAKINASMLSPGTKYSAYMVFSTKSGFHGFDYQPAEASVGISGHDGQKRTVCFDINVARMHSYQYSQVNHRQPPSFYMWWHGNVPIDHSAEYPKLRTDGWMEVELGEFLVEGKKDGDVEISLMEVKGRYWKWGLIIQGIEIRPKAG
ncbi:F-box PP2-B10-like [Olea europaea subsp. europaea]|uniref:F-box PP2-B10-like n=1 Tax=Olea europaea subsp. europaea TaxID=158383 RepID=A0A8S0T5C1_OLEEU|nr:F-box PP2-B10-like [Olea europaea subsp. europaea]